MDILPDLSRYEWSYLILLVDLQLLLSHYVLHSRFKVVVSIFTVIFVSVCQPIIQVGRVPAPTEKPN